MTPDHPGAGRPPESINDALWEFPHTMTLKVFGDAQTPPGEPPLADLVCAILARRLGDFVPQDIGTRPSSGGKYLALSLTVTVQDREQLEGIYRDLRAEPRVRTAI
ncbi:MAG: YbeD family protein [Pseudomonadota bacterium]